MSLLKKSARLPLMGSARASYLLNSLKSLAIVFPVFIVVFSWRSFAQALVAKLSGDRTAEEEGFLTLNPITHINVTGILILICIILILSTAFSFNVEPEFLITFIIILEKLFRVLRGLTRVMRTRRFCLVVVTSVFRVIQRLFYILSLRIIRVLMMYLVLIIMLNRFLI